MSERGSFVTEYINCAKCFQLMKEVLLTHKHKYMCATTIPSWEPGGKELPIIAGKIGGLHDNEELEEFHNLLPILRDLVCPGHSIRIAVLADSGASQIFTVKPWAKL